LLICSLRRIPYVYYAADLVSMAARGMGLTWPILRLLECVESLVLRHAAIVLTVSDQVAARIVAMGASPDRVSVVGTGVDTEIFTDAGERLDLSRPTAVYAGTMSEIQGASVFVKAMARVVTEVPDARLVMLGQGNEMDHLRRLAADLPDRSVQFPGVVDGNRTAKWLRSARVGLASVRPGCGYDVAFATKAFASTAAGTPVVFAGVGPSGQIVTRYGLGRAVAWDPESVSRAMIELLSTHPEAGERKRLAEFTKENYSLDAVASRAADAVLQAALRGREIRNSASPG
jgi:glycosyltransferase involved in cell wall biosynthesis